MFLNRYLALITRYPFTRKCWARWDGNTRSAYAVWLHWRTGLPPPTCPAEAGTPLCLGLHPTLVPQIESSLSLSDRAKQGVWPWKREWETAYLQVDKLVLLWVESCYDCQLELSAVIFPTFWRIFLSRNKPMERVKQRWQREKNVLVKWPEPLPF